MGIINYSGKFMTCLAVISEHLKGLLGKDVVCHGQVLCGVGAVGLVVLLDLLCCWLKIFLFKPFICQLMPLPRGFPYMSLAETALCVQREDGWSVTS